MRLLRRHGRLWLLQWTGFESSFVPMALARWDDAAKRIGEALELNDRLGSRAIGSWFEAHHGWVHRARGDYGAAIAELVGRRAKENPAE